MNNLKFMIESLPENSFLYMAVAFFIGVLIFVVKNVATANLKPYIEKYGIVSEYWKKINIKKTYFLSLYQELSKMPFVLHDFELDIEGNYVEVRDNKIDKEIILAKRCCL